MKKAANILYLLFIIITLAGTAYLIYDDYQGQVDAARSEIEQNLIAHQQKLDDFFKEKTYQNDREFQTGIADLFKQDEKLRGIIMMIPGETLIYNHLESENEKLLEMFETPELSVGPDSILYSYKTPFYESYQKPVTTGLEKNIQSFYIYEVFNNEDVYRNLKRSLIIIGSLFFLTLIILILVSRSIKQEELEEDTDDPLLANIENNESWNTPVPNNGKEISNSTNEMDDSDFINDMDFDMPEDSNVEESSKTDSLDNLAFDTDFPEEPEAAPASDDDLGDFNFDMDDLPDDDEEMPILDMDEMDSLSGTSDEENSQEEDSLDFNMGDLPDEEELPSLDMDADTASEEMGEEMDDIAAIEDLDFDLVEENAPDSDLGDLPSLAADESVSEVDDLDSMDDLDFDIEDMNKDESTDTADKEEAMDFELPDSDVDDDLNFDLGDISEDAETEEHNSIENNSADEDDSMSFDLPEEDEDTLNLDVDEDDTLSFDLDDLEDMSDEDSLYDETGLSKEAFITERLDQELNRSASNNENLSVSFVQAEGLDQEGYSKLIEEIKEISGNADLNFKWQNQGICIIDQNKDLTSVLVALDQLNQKYGGQLRVGTSARNERLVESAQLLKEARHALDRTNEQKPVIGFQADPEKYRLLVSEEN